MTAMAKRAPIKKPIKKKTRVEPEIMRASPVPLYIQIEEELRGLIDSGTLGPLAKVPSEAELSARFKVSRMTARKALDRLVGDGVLFRQPGKGTFIAESKISHGPSLQLSFSAAMSALALKTSTRVLEAALVPAPSNVAKALGAPVGGTTVFVRRLRSVGGVPAAIHMSYLPSRFSPVLKQDLTGSLFDLMSALGGRADTARDMLEAVAATGDDAALLKVERGAPLVFIHGTAYSATGEPLRYTEALYRADRFRFSVDGGRAADLRLEVKRA
jgi:GntR family transcriptional regulator